MKDNSVDTEFSDSTTHLARVTLLTFLLTFMIARIIVFLVMSRTIPPFYLYIKGTHIHHLNYGIFLLSALGAYLLFARPQGVMQRVAAAVYGAAMALTFDEFGMWIHSGGSYWQRASWDAVVVISACLALLAFAPSIRRFRPRHWVTATALLLTLVIFILLFLLSFRYAGQKLGPKMLDIELQSPN